MAAVAGEATVADSGFAAVAARATRGSGGANCAYHCHLGLHGGEPAAVAAVTAVAPQQTAAATGAAVARSGFPEAGLG